MKNPTNVEKILQISDIFKINACRDSSPILFDERRRKIWRLIRVKFLFRAGCTKADQL